MCKDSRDHKAVSASALAFCREQCPSSGHVERIERRYKPPHDHLLMIRHDNLTVVPRFSQVLGVEAIQVDSLGPAQHRAPLKFGRAALSQVKSPSAASWDAA